MQITIGYTLSDRAGDYIPFDDGYRPGAPQEEVTVDLDGVDELDDTQIAELVFVATNIPERDPDGPYGAIITAVGRAVADDVLNHHSSLSKGDTVTVRGVRYECASTGFDRVGEADPSGVVWGERRYGQLTPSEKAKVLRWAADKLSQQLNHPRFAEAVLEGLPD